MCTRVVVLVSEIGSKVAAFECDKIAFMPNDPLTGSALHERARKIKLFLMDIDGTLTDGGVCLISLPNNGGVAEMKVFNSQDGLGLTMARSPSGPRNHMWTLCIWVRLTRRQLLRIACARLR
jgi:hypothetical protein